MSEIWTLSLDYRHFMCLKTEHTKAQISDKLGFQVFTVCWLCFFLNNNRSLYFAVCCMNQIPPNQTIILQPNFFSIMPKCLTILCPTLIEHCRMQCNIKRGYWIWNTLERTRPVLDQFQDCCKNWFFNRVLFLWLEKRMLGLLCHLELKQPKFIQK